MADLAAGFESDLRDAVLDEAEAQLYDARNNLAFQFLQTVNNNFRDYARNNDYELDSIIESGRVADTSRTNRGVSVTLEWGPLSALFEFGVSPHTIEGSPLAFEWPAPPQGTRPPGAPGFVVAEEVNWGSETGGIPESRAIRGALNNFTFQAQGGRITL